MSSKYFFLSLMEINKGNTIDNLKVSVFINNLSLAPPLHEQQHIVEHLDKQTQQIASTIEKESQRIELLKEYRQALISEVVTGKIDVRDEVIA